MFLYQNIVKIYFLKLFYILLCVSKYFEMYKILKIWSSIGLLLILFKIRHLLLHFKALIYKKSCFFFVAGVNISCPMNINTHTDKGSLEAVVTWEEPVVHGGDDEDLWVRSSHQPGQSFHIGQTQVQYVVFDSSNETVTDCQFQIEVIGRIWSDTICGQ